MKWHHFGMNVARIGIGIIILFALEINHVTGIRCARLISQIQAFSMFASIIKIVHI